MGTILHEDSVIVLSKMSGTIQNIGKIYDGQKENEISFLPGIPAEKFFGKRFETMHLGVHCIRNGKIKQNYHIEDWSTAIHQMLYNRPAPDFGFERDFDNVLNMFFLDSSCSHIPRSLAKNQKFLQT